MAQIDPTKLHVDSKVLPIWEQEPPSFQDLMAEQIRHAPWLVLSAVVHAVVLLLAYVLVPAETKKEEEIKVEMQLQEQKQIEEPPPPPPPEPEKEITKDEPVLQDSEVTETTETTNDASFDPTNDATSKESAFDSNQWNAAVGLGGGAGGKSQAVVAAVAAASAAAAKPPRRRSKPASSGSRTTRTRTASGTATNS